MKKCAIYIRVSGTEQSNSLEAQESRVRAYCQYHDIEIIEMIIDEHVSGGTPIYTRKNGSRLKELIKTGQINSIVTAKQDRIFRNTIDALTTVDLWNNQGVSLHIIDMSGIAVDTVSATGKMIFTFLCAKDTHEREITGERTKNVLNHKKKNLKLYSTVPYGYANFEGSLVPDEHQQEGIKLMKLLQEKGISLRKIIEQLDIFEFKPVGGGEWHASTVKQILDNELHETH